MPSKLLIQVPRFGRQFKTYEKIIPDLKLSITDLTEEYIQSNLASANDNYMPTLYMCICMGMHVEWHVLGM